MIVWVLKALNSDDHIPSAIEGGLQLESTPILLLSGSKPSQRFSVGAPVAKMVRISVLRDCLNNIVNAEKRGKRQVLIRPNSKVIIKFLQVMQKHGYIGDLEIIDDHRAGKVVVELIGRINKCGVISPRFDAARLTLVAKRLQTNHTLTVLGTKVTGFVGLESRTMLYLT